MAASSSKGTAGRLKQKNSEMAARMKADGERRSTMKCPVCHKLIGINSLFAHMGKGDCR